MATITYPSNMPKPASMRWSQASNTQIATSPLAGQSQTQELPGARWMVSIDYPPQRDAAVKAAMRAFFISMRGQANRVALWPFDNPRPRGTIAGTPLVNGGSQTGSTLNIDGVTNGTTLLAGDFFSVPLTVGSQLFMVKTDVTASGGAMAIAVEPPIRSSPANDAVVTTLRPTALFALASPEVFWRVDAGLLTGFSADFIELFA